MKKGVVRFFNKNNMGELSAAATTDLSFMEMYAMNMINTVVNGYITGNRPHSVSCFLQSACGFCRTGWSFCSRTLSALAGKAKPGKMHLFIRKHRMIW